MIKRYLAGIALLTVITMSGCSAKVQETTADAGTTPAASAPAAEAAADSGTASDVIEIEFWHALENQYEETLNRVVGDFNSTHDSIVVKPMYIGNYSALNEAIVSANAANTNLPGVAMANIPYVTGYGAGGLCEDLGPYIQRDGFEIDDFGEGLIQAAKYEDVQVALPFLVSTEVVYYNRELMKELGLEMPKTWDEMREVARKLTIKEGNSFVQAGLNFNGTFHQNYLLGLNYQLGQDLFEDDKKTATVNNDAMKAVMQLLVDLYEVDGVGSKDFGAEGADSFGQGQSAMTIQWGHFNNTLKTNFPDINFGVFEIPVFEENPYAYNRYNGESTFGINKNAPADQQAVAQDIVKYFLANNDIQKKFNIAMSTFPAKKSLAEDAEILANPSMAVLADHIDRYIWPGPMPATMETSLKTAGENVFFNGMSIDDALAEAEETIHNDMKNSSFESVESLYKYAE